MKQPAIQPIVLKITIGTHIRAHEARRADRNRSSVAKVRNLSQQPKSMLRNELPPLIEAQAKETLLLFEGEPEQSRTGHKIRNHSLGSSKEGSGLEPITRRLIAEMKPTARKVKLSEFNVSRNETERMIQKEITVFPRIETTCRTVEIQEETKLLQNESSQPSAASTRFEDKVSSLRPKESTTLNSLSSQQAMVKPATKRRPTLILGHKKPKINKMLLELLERTKISENVTMGKGTVAKVADDSVPRNMNNQIRKRSISPKEQKQASIPKTVSSEMIELARRSQLQTKLKQQVAVYQHTDIQKELVEMVRQDEHKRMKQHQIEVIEEHLEVQQSSATPPNHSKAAQPDELKEILEQSEEYQPSPNTQKPVKKERQHHQLIKVHKNLRAEPKSTSSHR